MHTKRQRRGQMLVEFALMLSLLMVLLFGIIQYGLYMNALVTLNHISREGARYAAVHPETDSAITSYIQSITPSSIGYSNMIVGISPAEGSATRVTGNPISVTLTYNMQRKMFLPSNFLGVPIMSKTVRVKTSMVIE